jgi:C-terminal processing protease CtpA/Prc
VRVREVGEGGIEDLRKRMLGGLEGVRGLVVDLRDADGSNGTAGTYAALSDVVRGATAPGGRADARTQVKGVALVVLVNERTAGAAEAVVCLAATSGLCTVVGSVLPGLRCGLIPLPLDGGMRVRMPGPCFVTLDGSPLAVPKPAVEVAAGEDPDVVLAKAVEVALEALR